MNKEWIEDYIEKRMVILFAGKRLDIPLSFRKDIAVEIERAIKTTYEKVENEL